MKDVLTGKKPINAAFCMNLAFILFFSYRSWFGMLRLSRSRITILGSILVIYALMFAAAALSRKKNGELLTGIIFLGCIATIFMVTWVFHPDYASWYFDHPDYNLLRSVFFPTGGIFAFLFVYMIDNVEDMRANLRAVAWLMFIFAIYQLIPVFLFGHWGSSGADTGDPSAVNQSSYSLSFGYRTIISLMVFWTEYRRTRERKYLILAVICLGMIVMYGGRGTLLAFMIFMGIRYLFAGKPRSRRVYLFVFLVLVLGALWYTGTLYKIVTGIIGLFGNVKMSRSLRKLLNGSFFQDEARLRIWSLAVGLIKTGGIFGHGPYGDRMVIGQYYSWGYSHNVFLELMVDFGLFGLLLIILLVSGIIWFLRTMDARWKDMFIIFFGMACQLLVSDSFWYSSAFWAIFALLLKHRKYLLSRTAAYTVCNPIFEKMSKERIQKV